MARQSHSKPNISSRYAKAKNYGKKQMTILVIVLIALIIIGLCGFRFAYTDMLPDVIEMSEQEATQVLNDHDLKVEIQRDWSDRFEEGMVIRQEPQSGSHISAGDTVTIVISKGPESVSMPNLAGVSRDEAVNTLSKSSVSWIVSEVYSDEVAVGNVISQMPEAGVEITSGQNVLLVISKGTKPEVRTADDVEVTKKTSADNDRDTTTTTNTTTSSNDDEDDEETTTTNSSNRTTENSTNSSTSNSSQSSQSNSSQSTTDNSANTSSPTNDSTTTDTSESTGDPGLDEMINVTDE